LVAIVRFQVVKLVHEHIYWNQVSVLVQLGKLDPVGKLDPAGLPVAGQEAARKVLDKTRPSNTLVAAWDKSEGKPL
jgi:carboxymethylenebutenolidase